MEESLESLAASQRLSKRARQPLPDAPATSATALRSGEFVLATFNTHVGIDGWGRPYDTLTACERIRADVLVLTETWIPDDPGRESQAHLIAGALGYHVVEQKLAGGRRAKPDPRATDRWMRSHDWRGAAHSIYLDSERRLPRNQTRTTRFLEAEPGWWGVAVLSRLPLLGEERFFFPQLRRDRSRRAVIVARFDLAGHRLALLATHMSHLSYGSPIHFRLLNQVARAAADEAAAVIAGDMNLWGPPVHALMPGWRSAVRGKTWPSWRPHSQLDHILLRGPVEVTTSEVLGSVGSDHLPIRATLRLGHSPYS